MKILGMVIIAFGLVDLVGSYTGLDLWGKIGIELPELIWQYSSFIEIGLGFFIMKIGSNESDGTEESNPGAGDQ